MRNNSNAAEKYVEEKYGQENYSEDFCPLSYSDKGYDESASKAEVISLQAERENFFYNPELYLELALQDIEYQYSSPEYYLAVVAAWLKPLSYHSAVKASMRELANDFLRRTLSSTSRSFAFALYELGNRKD